MSMKSFALVLVFLVILVGLAITWATYIYTVNL